MGVTRVSTRRLTPRYAYLRARLADRGGRPVSPWQLFATVRAIIRFHTDIYPLYTLTINSLLPSRQCATSGALLRDHKQCVLNAFCLHILRRLDLNNSFAIVSVIVQQCVYQNKIMPSVLATVRWAVSHRHHHEFCYHGRGQHHYVS